MGGTRLTTPAAIAVIAVLAATGCGGGNGDGDGTTKEDFVTRADDICGELREQGAALERQNPRSPEQFTRFADSADEFVSEGLRRIRGLELPEDSADRDAAEQWIAQLARTGEAIDRLKADAGKLEEATEARDRAEVQEVGTQLQQSAREVKEAGDEADRRAQDLGLEVCGKEN